MRAASPAAGGRSGRHFPRGAQRIASTPRARCDEAGRLHGQRRAERGLGGEDARRREQGAGAAHRGRDGAPSRPPRARYPLLGTRTEEIDPWPSTTPVTLDRERIQELIEREEKRAQRPHRRRPGEMFERANKVLSAPASPRPTSCATRGRSTSSAASARRSGTSTATRCGTSTTASARWSRATRTPRSAARSQERYAHGTHFAAPTEDADRRRRGARPPLGPAEVALHELRLGVDDGRDPDRARLHGPRHRDEDLRLLPRPPRHRDGLDRRRVRQDRRPREPRLAALRRGHPAGDRRPDGRRCRSTTPARWSAGSSASTRRAASPPA